MLSPKTALALLLLTSMASAGDFHGRHAIAGAHLGARAGLSVRQEDNNPESGSPNGTAQTSQAPDNEDDKPQTSAPPAPSSSDTPPPATSDEPKPSADPTTPPPQSSAQAEPTTAPTSPAETTKPQETSAPPPQTSEEPAEQSTITRKETSQAAIITAAPKDPKDSPTSVKAQPTTLFGTVDYTTVVVTRNPEGQDVTSTKVQKTLRPTATAAPIDSSPKTESGMSPQTKTTVIGVVCGVGGAILLAGVFFLWWKWSSRRKQRAAIDDGDELVGMNAFQPSGMGEKTGAAGGGQGGLFKDNLESYHAPVNQRPANAGTNF